MGFWNVVNEFVSSIGSGVASVFSSQGKTSCACCMKCSKTSRGGDYKRVFICSEGQYVKNVGIPILATKVDDILNCYPPCMANGLYEYFTPYNPEIPSTPNPMVYNYDEYRYDWNENDREVGSDMSDDYYQE